MKHMSFTTLIIALGLMFVFSTQSNAFRKDPKAATTKDAKAACQKVCPGSSAQVMDVKNGGQCTMKTADGKTADGKACPYMNGKCVKGSCDEKAMKTADMKDCCDKKAMKAGDMKGCCDKNGAKATKTSNTLKGKKKATPIGTAGTN